MNQQQRLVKLRLSWFKHFKEKSQNVAKTCRYFGINRHSYYLWYGRYLKQGVDGLCDRSRRPKTSPKATRPDIIKKILKLRRTRKLGPRKIARFFIKNYGIKISSKTIYLILLKRGVNKLNKPK